MREHEVSGAEALSLASDLLQRSRLADPDRGLGEAADIQWWSRRPRTSDSVRQPFWLDADGPVAGVLMTSWRDDRWQCDPILLPAGAHVDPGLVWRRARDLVSSHARGVVELILRDDDTTFTGMAAAAGFVPQGHGTAAWMSTQDRQHPVPPGAGFTIVDRSVRADTPHPMRLRNDSGIVERLHACPLYDPHLDLAVETDDGHLAGYSLYWFDPITRVGLVEPMRVEEEFQRRGLATAMLLEGIDRLARRGAERIKIAFETDAASAVYLGVGFRPAHTSTTYEASVSVWPEPA